MVLGRYLLIVVGYLDPQGKDSTLNGLGIPNMI